MAEQFREGGAIPSRLVGTTVVGVLGVLVLASSYLRELTLAKSFGASRVLDLYLIALVVPQAIGLESGNIALALLLPKYSRILAQTGRSPRSELHRDLYNWVAVLSALALALVVAAPMVAALLGPGLTRAQRVEATAAIRLLSVLAPLLGLAGLARAWLDAQGRTWISAGLPSLRPLGIVVGIAIGRALGGPTVRDVILGALCGAAIAFGLQIIAAIRHSSLDVSAGAQTPPAPAVARSVGVLVAGSALNQGGDLLDKSLGSTAGAGQVAALNFATMILTIPMTILVTAVSTVALPELARLRFTGSHTVARATSFRYARALALLVLPIMALLVLTPHAIVTTVLGARSLTPEAVGTTSTCLSALALGQLFYVLTVVFRQQLVAHERYRALVVISCASLLVKGAASAAMLPSLGVVGLALATTAGSTVAFALTLLLMRQQSSE